MSQYNPPTELIEEAQALVRELESLNLNDAGGGGGGGGGGSDEGAGDQSTASASSALIAVAGLAGTAYFFMSDQE